MSTDQILLLILAAAVALDGLWHGLRWLAQNRSAKPQVIEVHMDWALITTVVTSMGYELVPRQQGSELRH